MPGEGTNGVAAVTERLTIEWDIFFQATLNPKRQNFTSEMETFIC